MDIKEILDSLTYNRDRLIVERGADFSGVKALNAAIDIMSGKKYDKSDDPVMGYLLKEASEAPEMYNEVSRILQRLFNGRIIGAEVILICTHVALEISKDTEETGHWQWRELKTLKELGSWHCSNCGCIAVDCVRKEDKRGLPWQTYCPECGSKNTVMED